MIRQFIKRVFGGSKKSAGIATSNTTTPKAPRVYAKKEHGINRADISSAALKTCEGLQDAGFQAFVVGGAVRDLLLQRHPKDFDVATSATPEQVRNVFRRSRIIGRRFRIVHVMFGQETVEVSTFRAQHAGADAVDDNPTEEAPRVDDPPGEDEFDPPRGRRRRKPFDDKVKASADEHGRLLRDNVFGSQAEDALRRDFTMNALFYDPGREEVWDYVNGLADIQKKRVVMIGEPLARYREDPVRMLRAARLAGKLGFIIDSATEKPIAELAPLLENVPPARIYDEMLKLLLSGHALACTARLRALGLHTQVLPTLGTLLDAAESRAFVELALSRTDARIEADKGVSPAFLFAALFWFPLQSRLAELGDGASPNPQQWHDAMDDTLDAQRETLAIPRRLDPLVKEIWIAQLRLAHRSRAKAYRMLSLPAFRACYDFLALRAEVDPAQRELADWWEKFQRVSDAEREAMLLPDTTARKKRRRRKSGGSRAPEIPEAVS